MYPAVWHAQDEVGSLGIGTAIRRKVAYGASVVMCGINCKHFCGVPGKYKRYTRTTFVKELSRAMALTERPFFLLLECTPQFPDTGELYQDFLADLANLGYTLVTKKSNCNTRLPTNSLRWIAAVVKNDAIIAQYHDIIRSSMAGWPVLIQPPPLATTGRNQVAQAHPDTANLMTLTPTELKGYAYYQGGKVRTVYYNKALPRPMRRQVSQFYDCPCGNEAPFSACTLQERGCFPTVGMSKAGAYSHLHPQVIARSMGISQPISGDGVNPKLAVTLLGIAIAIPHAMTPLLVPQATLYKDNDPEGYMKKHMAKWWHSLYPLAQEPQAAAQPGQTGHGVLEVLRGWRFTANNKGRTQWEAGQPPYPRTQLVWLKKMEESS